MARRADSRKADIDKRSETVGVRFTPGQKRAIERAAAKATLDPSVLMRVVTLREAGWNPDTED